jgi:hypothetical protein
MALAFRFETRADHARIGITWLTRWLLVGASSPAWRS